MKKTLTGVVAVLIIGIVTTVIIVNNNNELKDQTKTELKDGKSKEEVVLEKVIFSEITNTYEEGITTLTAKMLNNTKETKNFKIKIILKDDEGNELKSMTQIVENLEPAKTKILTTGIAGDYSSITKIEFKIVE